MTVTLNPYLNFNDQARAALEFYHSVFGGTLNVSTFADFGQAQDPSDAEKIMHGQLEGDNGLVLAQRLGEWVGKGPVLEEDIASTNVGLDLLGQARLWLAYAGEVEGRDGKPGRNEDQLAYFRDSAGYRNLLLVEQPNGNYADTIARQFLFDQWHVLLLGQLTLSRDERIAGIAAKAVKEARYHQQHSADWVVRLGDGTAESRRRMLAALDLAWPYAAELFADDAVDEAAADSGLGPRWSELRAEWESQMAEVLAEADLPVPAASKFLSTGKRGVHSEHMGFILAKERGWYAVVSSETVTFRKSLQLWQRFDVESRFIGHDEKAVFMEHRAVVDGEVYARVIVRARMMRRSGGTVGHDELFAAVGTPAGVPDIDDWIHDWATASALPPASPCSASAVSRSSSRRSRGTSGAARASNGSRSTAPLPSPCPKTASSRRSSPSRRRPTARRP